MVIENANVLMMNVGAAMGYSASDTLSNETHQYCDWNNIMAI